MAILNFELLPNVTLPYGNIIDSDFTCSSGKDLNYFSELDGRETLFDKYKIPLNLKLIKKN